MSAAHFLLLSSTVDLTRVINELNWLIMLATLVVSCLYISVSFVELINLVGGIAGMKAIANGTGLALRFLLFIFQKLFILVEIGG